MSVNSHPGANAIARKRPTQARSRATVDTILDAAAHVFAERGYTSTTTNHIATHAGLSIGSLYQYFPNKDALLVAMEERHLEQMEVLMAAATTRWRQNNPTQTEWAEDLVDTLIAANDSELHVLIYDTAPPLPQLRELTSTIVAPLTNAVAGQLRRWHHGTNARLRAEVLVVVALRLVHDMAIRTRSGRSRMRVRSEIIRALLAIAADSGIPDDPLDARRI